MITFSGLSKPINIRHLSIFTDGSVNTKSKIGYGAYLMISDLTTSTDLLKNLVKVKRFEQTSSTKLELQTLLWALTESFALIDLSDITLTIYTDSQNIIGLPGRRERLEKNNYFSSNNKRLKNYELYQEFYQLTMIQEFELVKVVGHQASHKKNRIDRLFSLVDKASRQELRRNT